MCSRVLWKTAVTYQLMLLETLSRKEEAIHLFNAEMLASSLGLCSSQMIQHTVEVCTVVR